jgi:hypothetical protein
MKIKLYNPTSEDFHIKHDTNGDRNPQSYILHAEEIEAFEEPVAEHIKNSLAHKIAPTIQGKGGYDVAFAKAIKMIEVTA